MLKKEIGFTLAELLVVLLIVAIFAALGLPGLAKTKESAIGREAQANLKLIAAAEKIYRMETGLYDAETNVSGVNSSLRLSIPSSSTKNWDYAVTASTDTFTATATRTTATAPGSYAGCTWSITHNTDKPTTSTCVP